LDFAHVVLLILIGVVAGGSGGLLGIGGSVVMIPGMILLFGPERQHLYQAAAMIVNFFVMAPAVWQHYRAEATLRSVTRWMIPSAIVGIVLGVYSSELGVFRGAGRGYLQIMFAVFLVYVVGYNVWRLRTQWRLPPMDDISARQLSKWRIVALVGLPTGILGGLLGIGGGLMAVPAQQLALKMPLPRAIANSASTIVWSSIIGAVLKNSRLGDHGFTLGQSLVLSACLIPSAMAASWYTSAKVHRWPVSAIRAAFVIVLLYAGIHVFVKGWQQVHAG
jgi:hypothetical protein